VNPRGFGRLPRLFFCAGLAATPAHASELRFTIQAQAPAQPPGSPQTLRMGPPEGPLQTLILRDDGQRPDVSPADGTWAGTAGATPGQSLHIEWGDQTTLVLVPPHLDQGELSLVREIDGLAGTFFAAPPPEPTTTSNARAPAGEQPIDYLGGDLARGLVVGLPLGALFGWAFGRRRPRTTLRPLRHLPPTLGEISLLPGQLYSLSVPLPEASLLKLARTLSPQVQILLLPAPWRAERIHTNLAECAHVHTLLTPHRDTDAIGRACARLQDSGPVVLLIDGLGALESPDAGEAPTAPLHELLRTCQAALLCVQGPDGSPLPEARRLPSPP
jgi:hypothetical protein